jgi:hypothetical protein
MFGLMMARLVSRVLLMRLSDAMRDAEFVEIDEEVFETAYVRVPDEDTTPDDVVMELVHGEDELDFTAADLEGAEAVGEGAFRLRSGTMLRFLSTPTLH